MKLNIFILFALSLLLGLARSVEEDEGQAEPGAVPMPKEPGAVPFPGQEAALPIEEPNLDSSENKPLIETPGPKQFPEPPIGRPRPFPGDEEPPIDFVGNAFTFQERVLHVLITGAEDLVVVVLSSE